MNVNGKASFLILGYYYPPMKAVGALRMYHLSRVLAGMGHTVTVISSDNAMKLEQEILPIPDAIEVHRIRTMDYRSVRARRNTSVHFNESVKSGRIGKFVVRALNSFPFNILIGEGGLLYTLRAYRCALKCIRTHEVTHLISSFRPYSDHLTARLLKRKYPHLHWTADFRDIHVDIIKGNVLWPGLQHWFNRYCLRKADLVTTVSEGCRRELLAYHQNVKVIYNGVAEIRKEKPSFRRKFTISYTGSLYGTLRNPSLVLEAIASLIKSKSVKPGTIEICYAGKDFAEWDEWINRFGLQEVSVNYGLIGGQEAMHLQAVSHLNLLLTIAHKDLKGALTAKFFEYLAAGRPMLVLINGTSDPEITSLVKRYQAGWVFTTEDTGPEEIARVLGDCYTAWQNGKMELFNRASPVLDEILWAARIHEFLDFCSAQMPKTGGSMANCRSISEG